MYRNNRTDSKPVLFFRTDRIQFRSIFQEPRWSGTLSEIPIEQRTVLASTGSANDGEVEDYAINIVSNPYRNAANPVDVNGDGVVSAIDALQVINYLYRNGSSQTQLPRVRRLPVHRTSTLTAMDLQRRLTCSWSSTRSSDSD